MKQILNTYNLPPTFRASVGGLFYYLFKGAVNMDMDFLKHIMNYFQCDRKMAETIKKASEKNGEIEKIKYMCNYRETQRSDK